MYTIGDFLIQIKNGYMARKKQLVVPYAKIVLSMGEILAKEGYIKTAEVTDNNGRKMITIQLLYKNKRPALKDVKLVSKPSLHRYVTKSRIKRFAGNFGISVVSTSRGVMTGKEALQQGVGGELLCEIS
ncbi:MAG: 30S ribosomal protein S8 [Candidatus Levybacteria bacterium]|nr:30S ribosomal protein S8 [Candidatus Levybacteria bacterium]MBP9814871.1 30S ribosomal protein S8 [Candidatus Levybacteria bacterium]